MTRCLGGRFRGKMPHGTFSHTPTCTHPYEVTSSHTFARTRTHTSRRTHMPCAYATNRRDLSHQNPFQLATGLPQHAHKIVRITKPNWLKCWESMRDPGRSVSTIDNLCISFDSQHSTRTLHRSRLSTLSYLLSGLVILWSATKSSVSSFLARL